jgi:hypothetical protein
MPSIPPPSSQTLLSPLLSSLPAAAVSPEPPAAILPLLSPILRQRVKLLSGSSQDPWLPLLCYEQSNIDELKQAVRNDRLEPHPVSGEVEVDWDYDVSVRYQRVDEETFQAFAFLQELKLKVKLVWCTGDTEGESDGWKIGEVSALGTESSSDDHDKGYNTIAQAEESFKNESRSAQDAKEATNGVEQDAEDDDDAYWAQYDNSSAQTPAQGASPAPPSGLNGRNGVPAANDDDYYAQYDEVQPAMDNHDPDEAQENGEVETTLGNDEIASKIRRDLDSHPELSSSSLVWDMPSTDNGYQSSQPAYFDDTREIAQPRASSSASSSGEETVAKLEKNAATHGQGEIAIKQHISTSFKSLYRLARAGGIEREEFERLVRTELDVLELMEEE